MDMKYCFHKYQILTVLTLSQDWWCAVFHSFHCPLQVTWQKLVNGTKQNVAIANPSLGVSVAPPYRDRVAFKNGAVRRRTPNLEDTTITFSSLRLSDECTYICEYTTFPAGNRENSVNLTVFGKTDMRWSGPQVRFFDNNLKVNFTRLTV